MASTKHVTMSLAAGLLSLSLLAGTVGAAPAQPRGNGEPDATPAAPEGFLDPDYPLGGVVGNADEVLPEGEDGELSVVAYGTEPGDFQVVVRNRTGEPVGRLSVGVAVRDGDGELIAVGSDVGQRYPAYLPDGGLAIAQVEFTGAEEIPDDAEYEFVLSAGDPPDGAGDLVENDLRITELEIDGGDLSGTAENLAEQDAFLPFVEGACFDEDGEITGSIFASVDPSEVAPGAEATITGSAPSDCDYYLVSVVA